MNRMKRLVLCLVVAGAGLSLASPPSRAIGPLLPNCIEYCCIEDPAKANAQCWYNSTIKTCSWFWQPGHSACL